MLLLPRRSQSRGEAAVGSRPASRRQRQRQVNAGGSAGPTARRHQHRVHRQHPPRAARADAARRVPAALGIDVPGVRLLGGLWLSADAAGAPLLRCRMQTIVARRRSRLPTWLILLAPLIWTLSTHDDDLHNLIAYVPAYRALHQEAAIAGYKAHRALLPSHLDALLGRCCCISLGTAESPFFFLFCCCRRPRSPVTRRSARYWRRIWTPWWAAAAPPASRWCARGCTSASV